MKTPASEKNQSYELWRQDDNGNKFLVKHVSSQEEADEWVEKMTKRGHKQTYWSTPCPSPDDPSHKQA
jgi:hypothetical protein